MFCADRLISIEYRKLIRSGVRFAKAGSNADAALVKFRDAQRRFVSLLKSPEVNDALTAAYGGIQKLEGYDDATTFLREFMDDDQFDNEVRVSCFHGLQRSDVEKILLDIKENRSISTIPNGGVTATLIVEQVENRCNNFVVLVNASRAFDRRRKDRQKAYAIRMLKVSAFGAVSAVVNVPLALPTIGLAATISLGVTASSAVLAAQYAIEMGS